MFITENQLLNNVHIFHFSALCNVYFSGAINIISDGYINTDMWFKVIGPSFNMWHHSTVLFLRCVENILNDCFLVAVSIYLSFESKKSNKLHYLVKNVEHIITKAGFKQNKWLENLVIMFWSNIMRSKKLKTKNELHAWINCSQ